jgi:hypothetical protein
MGEVPNFDTLPGRSPGKVSKFGISAHILSSYNFLIKQEVIFGSLGFGGRSPRQPPKSLTFLVVSNWTTCYNNSTG